MFSIFVNLCVMQVFLAHGFMCCDFSFYVLGLESCLFQVNNILNHQKFQYDAPIMVFLCYFV
jgi:hypothetical protein